MEIKVDVHAVHPSGERPIQKTPLAKGSCGSWCTPESTPAHNASTDTHSNIETKTQLQENADQHVDFELKKLRLISSSPPPLYTSDNDITEAETEFIDYKPKSKDKPLKQYTRTPSDEQSDSTAETPQSPVPTSPIHEKKSKAYLKLSSLCDPFVPIDPQGRGYICWLLLVTFCYSYNAWGIALRATFPYQTPQNTPLWMTADYLCDIVYLLDVAFVKARLMYLQEGFWVDGPVETRKNYRRKLQYKFDVVSLLPLDVFYFYFGTQRVILRWPRLLKLQTFWEFHQAIDRILSSPYVVRIGKMLFYIFYLIHLNACAYYAMSDYIGLGSNGWVYDNQGSAYIRCFYFATKTATSIGKNPKPENTMEYLYMTAAWLMGVFVFALLIGQIRDIIATATRARTEYRKSMDCCARFLRRLNLPRVLQRRVVQWFRYTWRRQRCFDESKILNSLPFNMKRDVALAVHMTTLSKVQLFRDCSASLLRDLVLQLRPVSCLPGDVLLRRGDVGHHMYIVSSGECCVMSDDETEVLATLREGSVFGEISLLGIDGMRRRTATVRARGYTSLFALSKYDLDQALKHHKQAAQVLRRRADQLIQENTARSVRYRMQVEEEEQHERERERILQERVSALRRRVSAMSNIIDRASGLSRKMSEMNEETFGVACSAIQRPVPTIILSTD